MHTERDAVVERVGVDLHGLDRSDMIIRNDITQALLEVGVDPVAMGLKERLSFERPHFFPLARAPGVLQFQRGVANIDRQILKIESGMRRCELHLGAGEVQLTDRGQVSALFRNVGRQQRAASIFSPLNDRTDVPLERPVVDFDAAILAGAIRPRLQRRAAARAMLRFRFFRRWRKDVTPAVEPPLLLNVPARLPGSANDLCVVRFESHRDRYVGALQTSQLTDMQRADDDASHFGQARRILALQRFSRVGAQERRVPLETSRSASMVRLGIERVAEVFENDLGEVRIEAVERAEIGAGRLEHRRRRSVHLTIQYGEDDENKDDEQEKPAAAAAHGAATSAVAAATVAASAGVAAMPAAVAAPAARVAAAGIR